MLWPLSYQNVSWRCQWITGRFCWSKDFLPTCLCWPQLPFGLWKMLEFFSAVLCYQHLLLCSLANFGTGDILAWLLQVSFSISPTTDNRTTSSCPECCRKDDFQPCKTETCDAVPYSAALATCLLQNNIQTQRPDAQYPSWEVFILSVRHRTAC